MISVIVPFAGECPHRARAWQWLKGRFDGLEVVEGHGDSERWCKAHAVADGLSRASGDLLVLHDADCYSPHLHRAIQAVEDGAPWASPHKKVWRLTEAGTDRFIRGEREDLEYEQRHTAHLGGGIIVLPRETYEKAPLDPRFVGWGQEDDAFALALTTLAGKPTVLPEPLIHLWHPPQQRKSRAVGSNEGKALLRRYRAARRPDQMRALLGEVSWPSSSVTPEASPRS